MFFTFSEASATGNRVCLHDKHSSGSLKSTQLAITLFMQDSPVHRRKIYCSYYPMERSWTYCDLIENMCVSPKRRRHYFVLFN
ncbi:hypothetical protein OIU84_000932 [Salix udensis]|uniref:Uncharacterized protein n=1 Tax=Salix udensis TaxID=889485 RepID=A0AAD6L5R8_9ROSI|nr:hypothetical protein OIU84_000932 [Salix udensis]